jgi:hypothetical protein
MKPLNNEQIVRRLVEIMDGGKVGHPDYILEGVIDPIADEIDTLCLDLLGVPPDETCSVKWEEYARDPDKYFSRDYFKHALFENRLEDLFQAAKEVREGAEG